MNESRAGAHSFSIPVMGIAFSIDAPLKVARYGLSSVVSLVDDLLLEKMRGYHSRECGHDYVPIPKSAPDGRARRVTAYFDFLHLEVARQAEALRTSAFEPGTEITRYFELLPDGPLRRDYEHMLTAGADERPGLEEALRKQLVVGSIDANVMTKLDRDTDVRGAKRPAGDSDALAAARGFANSTGEGALVMSAGMNPRLFAHLGTLAAFLPDAQGHLRKRLVLKVSDYRSAAVQGKLLAKKGLWVSEYRIESGLNCGGHAFATPGKLIGPILAEFKEKRAELEESLLELCNKALTKTGGPTFATAPETRITVQGGIGTAAEDQFLRSHYGVDGTAWGTPFLLVPEVTNVDARTRAELISCEPSAIQLSDNSPLGVPFWNLTTSASEDARRNRIEAGKPGSPCPKGFVALHQEEGKLPLCRASRVYQKAKLADLVSLNLAPAEHGEQERALTSPSCICHDLGGGATLDRGLDDRATPAICPGPNLVNFRRVMSLDEMVGHIYGRCNVIARADRPHMFLRELELYVEDLTRQRIAGAPRIGTYETNLREAVEYYRQLALSEFGDNAAGFIARLTTIASGIDPVVIAPALEPVPARAPSAH